MKNVGFQNGRLPVDKPNDCLLGARANKPTDVIPRLPPAAAPWLHDSASVPLRRLPWLHDAAPVPHRLLRGRQG